VVFPELPLYPCFDDIFIEMKPGDAVKKILKPQVMYELLSDPEIPVIHGKPLAKEVLEHHKLVDSGFPFPVHEQDSG